MGCPCKHPDADDTAVVQVIKTDPAIFFTAAKLEEAHFKQLAQEAAADAAAADKAKSHEESRTEQPKKIIKMGIKMLESQNVIIDRGQLAQGVPCHPVPAEIWEPH